MGYSTRGHKELDATEELTHTHTHTRGFQLLFLKRYFIIISRIIPGASSVYILNFTH